MRQIDSIEEHRQLGRIELRPERAFVDFRDSEAPPLKALVVHDEAAIVPAEDLRPVALLRDEDEEVASVEVLLEAVADDR